MGKSLTHGATSNVQIRPLALNHRRRILRRLGLKSGELDAIARGYVDLLARLSAKIDLCDAYIDEHGLLSASGEPQPLMKMYVSLANSFRLTLSRLEDHLGQQRSDAGDLDAYLEANYSED